jgi:hypothetical protein
MWRIPPPGRGDVYVTDPVWASDARLKKWLIAGVYSLGESDGRSVYGAPKLWWLELDDQADAIVAAGRLTARAPAAGRAGDQMTERFPSIGVGPEGRIRLAYLTRSPGERTARLRLAEIRIDTETGRPVLERDEGMPADCGEGLTVAPILFSADARQIFGRSGSGRLGTYFLRHRSEGDSAAGRG